MRIDWDERVEEILANDLAAGLAYATPAKGVVIAPMAPLGSCDRDAGTITLSTSVGLPTKLQRIRANPQVAIAYHAREHSSGRRPEFVLVQGRASFPPQPDRAWLDSITPQWERFLGPRARGLQGRWLEVYYWNRVPITVEIERIVVWPSLDCAGEPTVFGAPLPTAAAPPQRAPAKGTTARIPTEAVLEQARRLPHTLLGWIGADGFPTVISVAARESSAEGLELESAAAAWIPEGGRRVGLTSHEFQPRMVGQEQRVHTGWLEASRGSVCYSPHTKAGYRLPASKALVTFASGIGTRLGLRKARAAGLAD